MVAVRLEGTFEPTTDMLSKEAGPICWHGMSCEFTLQHNVLWRNVTEHIYIRPFGILLMEGHTEIERILRSALFMVSTQHRVVIPFQLFGITNWSHLQGSICPRRTSW